MNVPFRTQFRSRLSNVLCLYKIVSTATRDDVQVFTKKHVSAPFVLTRTHPCPTFDICCHVWAESFHCFNHCNGI